MKEYYRRNLPHFHPSNAIIFVTFRLHGSLPAYIIETIREEYKLEIERFNSQSGHVNEHDRPFESYRWYFEQFDAFLENQRSNNQWLNDDRIAQLVSDAIHFRNGKDYDLIAFTIMPNHVHLIIELNETIGMINDSKIKNTTRASAILHSLKRYTAFQSNKMLQRNGAFWQSESYDRVIRNEKELEYTINYILNNPVKAGLVREWKDWKFSYCKYSL